MQITQYPSTNERGKFRKNVIPMPELGDDDVLLEMVACGVCHTDCVFMGQDGLVLGHEPIGKVVKKGKNVDKLDIGDYAGTSYLRKACLDCPECNSGQDALCEKRVMFPEGNNNGYADYLVSDRRFTFKLPDQLEPKYAAPLMCAGLTVFTGLYISNIRPTGRVAVVGIGGLGHLALQFANAWGCHVTAISGSPDKKEEAIGFGAHDFLVSKEFTKESIAAMDKFDLILDTVSSNLDWDTYISLLNSNGIISLIGLPGGPVEIKDPMAFLGKQRILNSAITGGRYLINLMLEFAVRHNIKPKIEEYSYDLEGIEKAIARCDVSKTRYRAVLVKH